MKTALLDSSVWISFFTKDSNSLKAEKIISKVSINKQRRILMPNIVFIEIINNLRKLGINDYGIQTIMRWINNQKIFTKLYGKKYFWNKKMPRFSKLVRLKTHDLIILGFALEYKNTSFYTFDVKQRNAFQHIITQQHAKKRS